MGLEAPPRCDCLTLTPDYKAAASSPFIAAAAAAAGGVCVCGGGIKKRELSFCLIEMRRHYQEIVWAL